MLKFKIYHDWFTNGRIDDVYLYLQFFYLYTNNNYYYTTIRFRIIDALRVNVIINYYVHLYGRFLDLKEIFTVPI